MAEQRLEEIRKARLQKVKDLRKKGINPYVSKPKGDFISIEKARSSMGKEVSVVGRLLGKREHGNCCFADIKDETASIQLFYQKEKLGEDYELLSYLDIGDFAWVKGKIIETSAGEI
jgi:lysyl-tRNA synthetase class 2